MIFTITPEDIAQLDDSDLRALVAELCKAELSSRGHSLASLTWGGHQKAKDGGVDVRVELPHDARIDGYIPRASTIFQCKQESFGPADIKDEMKPKGVLRPAIEELSTTGGAYIIVSGKESTSDSMLRDRTEAMQVSLNNSDQIHHDFYDRRRLADWVNIHPTVTLWVRQKVGRSLAGWQGYGAWCASPDGVESEYLVDEHLRLHLGDHRDSPLKPVLEAIDQLRGMLTPARVVRLVGLSGVGKTRLVQALFDARIGAAPLDPGLAIYTDLSHHPDPHPRSMAEQLIAHKRRSILIVDNCNPELHRNLAELCKQAQSSICILTIEYDIRDDQPEGTEVVRLETSSPELIEKIIRQRHSHLSQVDARTIAQASGGNARIALALASTVQKGENITTLSDNQLFERLFLQKHTPDQGLLRTAQACSLVYSFEGELFDGPDAELPRLAALAGQTVDDLYRHIAELQRRQLAQQRGPWRAILPHALANWLAKRALSDIPRIEQQLLQGSERLARSFSRRLSYLHDQPKAQEIAKKWLSADGLLGNLESLEHNENKKSMFQNVAPVCPEKTLETFERWFDSSISTSANIDYWHKTILYQLAYDPHLFERSAIILVKAICSDNKNHSQQSNIDAFLSLFMLYLSGTHATISQRMKFVEELLRSKIKKENELGLLALGKILKTDHFISSHLFEFGARSRDYGFEPKSNEQIEEWYQSALNLIEQFSLKESQFVTELRTLIAHHFHGLWRISCIRDDLELLMRKLATTGFWQEGWIACQQTMRWDKKDMPGNLMDRLKLLESDLRFSTLQDQVRAIVLGNRSTGINLDEIDLDTPFKIISERLEERARKLAAEVIINDEILTDLLPDLFQGGVRVWAFGRGLAVASQDRRATWSKLVSGLRDLPLGQQKLSLLHGFIAQLWDQDRDLAQELFDDTFDNPLLLRSLPDLHAAVILDERGVERLKRSLKIAQSPIGIYEYLAYGNTTDYLNGKSFKDLVSAILENPEGIYVAVEILSMRLFTDRKEGRAHDAELLDLGREILKQSIFKKNHSREAHKLAGIANACLEGDSSYAYAAAAEFAIKIKEGLKSYEISSWDIHDLFESLFKLQPLAVLNAWFFDLDDNYFFNHLIMNIDEARSNALDYCSCESMIIWCEGNPANRYTLMSSLVSFSHKSKETGIKEWSEQAKALLEHAPDPGIVLKNFVDRFWPNGWSGSRADVVESNARLLDHIEALIPSNLMSYVQEKKIQFNREVAQERMRETAEAQRSNERFE